MPAENICRPKEGPHSEWQGKAKAKSRSQCPYGPPLAKPIFYPHEAHNRLCDTKSKECDDSKESQDTPPKVTKYFKYRTLNLLRERAEQTQRGKATGGLTLRCPHGFFLEISSRSLLDSSLTPMCCYGKVLQEAKAKSLE